MAWSTLFRIPEPRRIGTGDDRRLPVVRASIRHVCLEDTPGPSDGVAHLLDRRPADDLQLRVWTSVR